MSPEPPGPRQRRSPQLRRQGGQAHHSGGRAGPRARVRARRPAVLVLMLEAGEELQPDSSEPLLARIHLDAGPDPLQRGGHARRPRPGALHGCRRARGRAAPGVRPRRRRTDGRACDRPSRRADQHSRHRRQWRRHAADGPTTCRWLVGALQPPPRRRPSADRGPCARRPRNDEQGRRALVFDDISAVGPSAPDPFRVRVPARGAGQDKVR